MAVVVEGSGTAQLAKWLYAQIAVMDIRRGNAYPPPLILMYLGEQFLSPERTHTCFVNLVFDSLWQILRTPMIAVTRTGLSQLRLTYTSLHLTWLCVFCVHNIAATCTCIACTPYTDCVPQAERVHITTQGRLPVAYTRFVHMQRRRCILLSVAFFIEVKKFFSLCTAKNTLQVIIFSTDKCECFKVYRHLSFIKFTEHFSQSLQ